MPKNRRSKLVTECVVHMDGVTKRSASSGSTSISSICWFGFNFILPNTKPFPCRRQCPEPLSKSQELTEPRSEL